MSSPSPRCAIPLLVGACVLVFAPSLFTRDPWNPDEPRHAEVSREMAVSGNYLVPHLNGEPYSDKPPIFYWLAAPLWLLGFGVNSGRVVALLASTGTVLVVYALGTRLRSRETGFLAALVTLTTLLFTFIGKFGVLDPLLAFFTTLSIYAAVRALEPGEERRERWWLAAYAASALAVLSKGPVGIAVPLLVMLVYAYIRRREVRKGGWWHLAGAALLLAMVAAWLVPAVLSGGDAYARDILIDQTAHRVVDTESHWQPFYFYLLHGPAFFFPWSLLLPLALVWAVREARRSRDAAAALGAAWFIAVFVFFTFISGKRERYLLPMVPSVGLLCAGYFLSVARGETLSRLWHGRLWKATLLLLGLAAVLLAGAALSPGPMARPFAKDPAVLAELRAAITLPLLGLAFTAAMAVVVACVCALRLPWLGAFEAKRAFIVVGVAVALSLVVDLGATPVINRFKSGRNLVVEAGRYLTDAQQVYLYKSHFSGVYNLFARRERMPILDTPDEARKALASGSRVAVIARDKSVDEIAGGLAARVVAVERVGHRKIAVVANWK